MKEKNEALEELIFTQESLEACIDDVQNQLNLQDDLRAIEEKLSVLEAYSWQVIEWQDLKYRKHQISPSDSLASIRSDVKRLVIAPKY